jgi:ribosomal protein L40E
MDEIDHIIYTMLCKLQTVDLSLRTVQTCYTMQALVCLGCGRTLPIEAKKCHPCNNSNLSRKHCTSDHRVAEYFVVLRKLRVWPSPTSFQLRSAEDLASHISNAKRVLKHRCGAGFFCPLQIEFGALGRKMRANIDEVTGFSLYPLHQA